MADIFLSYSEKDRALARKLADRLHAAGWSVWWDRRIPAGSTWRNLLAQELAAMRCMVVLWSSHSVQSEWVCEEASEGRQLGRLVPVAIEAVRPPAGFREIQAADLVGWDGAADHAGLQPLFDDIQRLIGAPTPPAATTPAGAAADTAPAADTGGARVTAPPAGGMPRRAVAWLAGAVLLLLLGAGIYLARSTRTPALLAVPAGSVAPAVSRAVPVSAPAPTTLRPVPQAAVTAVEPQATSRASPPRAASRPALASVQRGPVNPRCTALLERAALGETLSDKSLTFLRQECHR